MIFYQEVKDRRWSLTKRLLLIMKLAVFLTCLSVLQAAAEGFAQTVTLRAENISLVQAMQSIQQQSGHPFFLNGKDLAGIKVNVRIDNLSLEKAMDKLLKGKPVDWVLNDETIIVTFSNVIRHSVEEKENTAVEPIKQQKTVSGNVTDEQGEPLQGVTVSVKGTTIATMTDEQGNYSLVVADNAHILVFSIVGFESSEIEIANRPKVSIKLKGLIDDLDEVVVVGYGTRRKSDLTGSLASVGSSELTSLPVSSPAQALAGRASGVHVLPRTGSPGGQVNIRIRGTNSIMGSNEPLYVVDGFPFSSSPDLINNNDIASIEILKDASATAIYGSRGANGVVIITTKKGKAGKTNVNYTGGYSVNRIRKKLDLLNASEYAQMINAMFENDGGQPYFNDPGSFGEGTDWQDQVFHSAPLLNQSISLSGGNDKTVFSTSFGSYNEQGIIRNSDYSRYTLQANLSHQLNSYFDFSLNTNFSKIESSRKNSARGGRGNSMIAGMIGAPPTLQPYEDDGSLTILNRSYTYISDGLINPLNYLYEQTDALSSSTLLLNGAVTIKPLSGLSIKLSGGLENGNQRTDFYATKNFHNSNGLATIQVGNSLNLLSENIVTYSFSQGIHDFTALAGITYQSFVNKGANLGGSGFVSDLSETHDVGSADVFSVPGSSYTDWSLISYLSRVNYSFHNKYLFTASIRADGSSRYSTGNKWAIFPSGAFAWRMKKEDFLSDIELISDMKVRVGYGTSGSTAISPYQTLNVLEATKVVLDKELVTAYSPSSRLPSSLKWETTIQVDFGLDLALLDNRLRFTADYYVKNTKDLLNNVQIPSSTGYLNSIRNVGKIQNRGVELSVDADVIDRAFSWQVSGNIAFNRNKVVKLNDGQVIRGSNINITILNDYVNILKEGEPLGIFYGYREDGYDDQGRIIYKRSDPGQGLSSNDKSKIGNPNPKFTGGLNNVLKYKGFEFNLFLLGSYGNDIFNMSKATVNMDYLVGLNKTKDILYDSWNPENKAAKNPRLSKSNPINVSDRFIEDGSFLKVKNIQLGYYIPCEKLGLDWVRQAMVYISGQDLITFTKYSWFDPEVNSWGGASSINIGIDHLSYPTSKTISFGLKLDF
ncbi:TonB-dependent receptor [Parapedobacter tibetensis]|uniref:TonB-dependent receptor n=1 Tax=Parapedobacter tibetensis TaxID=2972951 RepID=UPI00214D49E9|nr:TonB-dependent receptor [Parapedobacter tibetensis]